MGFSKLIQKHIPLCLNLVYGFPMCVSSLELPKDSQRNGKSFRWHVISPKFDSWSEFSVPRLKNCHTPFRDSGNEASIRVPRMFHSHV
jgi:hypothetical protein